MKSHRNAKTNVYQRQLLIRRVRRDGWTQAGAAEAAGVSVRTVAKRLGRVVGVGHRIHGNRRRRARGAGWVYLHVAIDAERFIQTLLRQWASRTPFRSSARRTAALRPYLRSYNHRSRQPRPALAVDAFPRGCLNMNNLFDIHS